MSREAIVTQVAKLWEAPLARLRVQLDCGEGEGGGRGCRVWGLVRWPG